MTTFEERHGRPKPPRIHMGDDTWHYIAEHCTYAIWRSTILDRWYVDGPNDCEEFDTHAEAIAYAQAHAQERGRP